MTVVKFPVKDPLTKEYVLIPVTITQEGKKLAIQHPWCPLLQAEFKAMAGAQYHGYDKKNPRKLWTIDDSIRNKFRMDALRWLGLKDGKPVLGDRNPYARYDLPIVQVPCEPRKYRGELTPYYGHQREGVEFVVTKRQCILAWDMGCVSGDAIVHVNRANKGTKLSLREMYRRWVGGHTRQAWKDSPYETNIRSMVEGGKLRQQRVVNVLSKGFKEVVRIETASGRKIVVTPDHEMAISMDGVFKRADALSQGDYIVTNGQFIDKDGYVRVWVGFGNHPREWCGYVYEHILVAEAHLGRSIGRDEEVHHKNTIRHDNRPDNLQALPTSDHKRQHNNSSNIRGGISAKGGEAWLAARYDIVKSVTPAGSVDVYDVVCEDPHRNFVAGGFVVHNCGKTLIIGAAMEWAKANLGWDGPDDFWFVCKKGALFEVQLGFLEWEISVRARFMSYETMKATVETWPKGKKPPKFIVYDESTLIKSATAQRSLAALYLADSMRAEHRDPFVVCMTGTPAPKNPCDWWMQAEVACPGFIREGDISKFKKRLCIIQQNTRSDDGGIYNTIKKDVDGNQCWYDDERRCKTCGEFEAHLNHSQQSSKHHKWEKSINEVLLIDKRLKGFVSKKFKKDCLDLPERIYVIKRCRPTQQTKNAAQLIAKAARGAADALTKLRELSDGFQYQDVTVEYLVCPMCAGSGTMIARQDPENPGLPPSDEARTLGRLEDYEKVCDRCQGAKEVPVVERQTARVPCPKDDVLEELIEEHEDIGRLATYCGFTGSVDRVVDVYLKNKWSVVRVDGRGWKGFTPEMAPLLPADGKLLYHAFRFGQEKYPKLAFVAQASTAAHGLNFDCTPTIINYSRDFSFENALQGDDRNLRGRIKETLEKSGRKNVVVVDIVHLPSDMYILDNHKKKRRLQALTLGDVQGAIAAGSLYDVSIASET